MPFHVKTSERIAGCLRMLIRRGGWRVIALALVFAVPGCSGQTPFWEDSGTSNSTTSSVYYAGTDKLPLYGDPSASKPPLARLPLHKKVVRDKIEKGYARVTVDGTGQTGWVNNAKLIWKLPSSGQTTTRSKAPSAPPETQANPPASNATAPGPATAPTTTADAPPNGASSTPAKRGADPSMFDAF